jgi:SWI/SNF-related matrix-associated actin-dependent regulator of chromatin subfamily A member 5
MAVHKRLNGIPAVVRELQGLEDTPEKLEEERLIAQELIDTSKPLLLLIELCDEIKT